MLHFVSFGSGSSGNCSLLFTETENILIDSGVGKNRILSPLGHQSNTECGEAIAQYASPRLKHAWLCHLSDENNHPDLAEMTVKQILQSHGILVGNDSKADFKLDVLKRKTPSGIFDLTL